MVKNTGKFCKKYKIGCRYCIDRDYKGVHYDCEILLFKSSYFKCPKENQDNIKQKKQ